MTYLAWYKRQQIERWKPLERSAPPDRPFINLANSAMSGGDALLAQYADHLQLNHPPGAGWCADVDMMWGHQHLRDRLRDLYALPSADNVLTVAGGSQALFLAITALRRHLASTESPLAFVESPTYGPLFEIPAYLGFQIHPLNPQSEFHHPQSLHLLSNPNNPTGAFRSTAEIAALANRLPPSAYLLVDECFLSPAAGHESSATLHDPRIITIGGLTKPLGLGALRCGWIMAHGPILPLLRDAWTQGFNIGSPLAESLAAQILRDVHQHHPPLAARARQNLQIVAQHLDPLESLGLIQWTQPTRGWNTFPKILPLATAPDPLAVADRFYNHLLDQHHLALVPGQWFDRDRDRGAACFRLSFGGPPDLLHQGLTRLATAIEQLDRT